MNVKKDLIERPVRGREPDQLLSPSEPFRHLIDARDRPSQMLEAPTALQPEGRGIIVIQRGSQMLNKTHAKYACNCLFRMAMLIVALFVFQSESFAQQGTLTDNATFPINVSALTVQGSSATEGAAVSFIKFKLTPNLPPATAAGLVAKATLTLYVGSLNTSGSFNVYRVTSSWGESDTTAPTYDTASPVIIGVPVTTANSYVTVDLTTLVQQWLGTDGLGTGAVSNYGIALVANTTTTAFAFDSKESTTTSHPARLAVLLNHATTADTATDFTGTLAGDVTGTQNATVVSSVGSQSAASVANSTIAVISATDINTPGTIVKRDASGNFSAGTITASLNGNATSSTNATTANALSSSATINGIQVNGELTNATIGGNRVSGEVANATNATNAATANALANGAMVAGAQVSGNIPGNASSISGTITGNQVSSTVAEATLATNATTANVAKSLNRAAQDGDIAAPADGQVYYNTTANVFKVFDGATSTWKIVDAGAATTLSSSATISGNQVTGTLTNATIAGTAVTGNIAAGQISGNLTNATIDGYVGKAGDTMTGTLNLPGNGLKAGTNQLVLSTGNVGIGTAMPGVKLHVYDGSFRQQDTTGARTGQLTISTSGSGSLVQETNGGRLSFKAYNFDFQKWNGTTNWLHISEFGDVGIGTTSPGAPLDVVGFIRTPNGVESNAAATMQIGTRQAQALQFFTQNSVKMHITSDGNVGIGTATPNNKIQVPGLLEFNDSAANTFLGKDAGNYVNVNNGLYQGIYNSAAGYHALLATTTGSYNTAVGGLALSSNSVGDVNTAIGYTALSGNTTGRVNTALGGSALRSNTTGTHNLAIGVESLFANTTGGSNAAVGPYDVMYSNTTGSNNTALGYAALYHNTTASLNVAIGNATLYNNTTGAENVAVGDEALRNSTTGGQNVVIGASAGWDVSTGSNNIFIGYSARNVTSGSRNIIIGDNIYAPQPTANNQLDIGNLIFGTGLDGARTNISSGNIGIGTPTPQSTLQVNGYVQLALTAGAPPAADCDGAEKYGRMKVDATGNKLYVCTSTGWRSTTLVP